MCPIGGQAGRVMAKAKRTSRRATQWSAGGPGAGRLLAASHIANLRHCDPTRAFLRVGAGPRCDIGTWSLFSTSVRGQTSRPLIEQAQQ